MPVTIEERKKAKLCHVFTQQVILTRLFKEVHHDQTYVTEKNQ